MVPRFEVGPVTMPTLLVMTQNSVFSRCTAACPVSHLRERSSEHDRPPGGNLSLRKRKKTREVDGLPLSWGGALLRSWKSGQIWRRHALEICPAYAPQILKLPEQCLLPMSSHPTRGQKDPQQSVVSSLLISPQTLGWWQSFLFLINETWTQSITLARDTSDWHLLWESNTLLHQLSGHV